MCYNRGMKAEETELHETQTVLLVEDDLFFQACLLSMLERIGYRVETATDPKKALDRASQEAPVLAILNLASPWLGGVDLVRRLKAEAKVPHVLTYLSHVRIPAVREDVLAAGADKICANSAISMRLPAIIQEVLSEGVAEPVDEGE